MFEDISRTLLNDIDLVLIAPTAAVGVCAFLKAVGLLRERFKIVTCVAGCLTLSAGYVLALSAVGNFVSNTLLLTPQVYVLFGMAGTALDRAHWFSTQPAPSLWWLAIVAVIGHCWTRFMLAVVTSTS